MREDKFEQEQIDLKESYQQSIKNRQERKVMKDNLMVQQQVESVWQHMVGVICLNQTGRKKVKKILPKLFNKFPTPQKLLESDRETIADIIKELGMHNVRAQRIWRMSEEYLRWDGEDATKLFGIGKYGSDSYQIFYKNKIPENVQDKELKRYIREELDV
tara:strand:+ start:38 stop:517 length:480 start_codon:yes stop_codon:yes gene_type:complete